MQRVREQWPKSGQGTFARVLYANTLSELVWQQASGQRVQETPGNKKLVEHCRRALAGLQGAEATIISVATWSQSST